MTGYAGARRIVWRNIVHYGGGYSEKCTLRRTLKNSGRVARHAVRLADSRVPRICPGSGYAVVARRAGR